MMGRRSQIFSQIYEKLGIKGPQFRVKSEFGEPNKVFFNVEMWKKMQRSPIIGDLTEH